MNTDWFTVSGGDGFYTRQDPYDWAIVYAESQDGSMTRHDLRNGTQKSIRPTVAARGGGTAATANEIQRANSPSVGVVRESNADTVAGGPDANAPAGGRGGGGGRGGPPNVNAPLMSSTPLECAVRDFPHNPSVVYMASQFFQVHQRADAGA